MSRVRLRDSSSWWLDHPDGTVTLVILRRIEGAMGGWAFPEFTGPSEEACLAQYDDYCSVSAEASLRRAGARANHGIKSYLP